MNVLTEPQKGFTIGKKAEQLFLLKNIGLKVPSFVVLPYEELFERLSAIEVNPISQKLNIDDDTIQQIISSLPLTKFYSVRSSANEEDGNIFSFAGQFDTYLFVTKEHLSEKIISVWQSSKSQRVQEYKSYHQINNSTKLAVIVQQMIDAESSGIAFGLNPINCNPNQKVITSVWGVGEGIVSGNLVADTFILENNSIFEKTIVLKTQQYAVDETNGGLILKHVSPEIQKQPSIAEQYVYEIVRTLELLKSITGKAQDIEFAVKDHQLYYLQTRPITTISKESITNNSQIVWDNSNIIESYPEVTSPLTFSFILPVYESVYRQFCSIMGVSKHEIEENNMVFSNMLGYLNGKVYYNLLSWYKALSLLPGFSFNAEFMEKMMGVKERFEIKNLKKRKAVFESMRVLYMFWKLIQNHATLPNQRNFFTAEFHQIYNEYQRINLNQMSAHELMELYNRFEQTLLKKWKAPLVNDFFAMIYFGVLQKLVKKYNLDEDGSIQNQLLSGANDIISTQPAELCLKISELIQHYPNLKNTLLNNIEQFEALFLAKKLPEEIQLEIESYLLHFGDRCVGELKLETVTYKQNPSLFFPVIKSYVSQGLKLSTSNFNNKSTIRENAELIVKTKLRQHPIKQLVFKKVLRRTRILVSARENLRFERTKAFGVVRELFNKIGERFEKENLIEKGNHIFYLTKEEIFSVINGTMVTSNLKSLIDLRMKEMKLFKESKTPERITTTGIPYTCDLTSTKKTEPNEQYSIKGIACCAGVVHAKVQVLVSPNETKGLNGDILVTSSTDPGWITLFPGASGILVERGSLLSHSAIVSREMGKPCIVGITNLLHILKTGDVVEMNGSTGHIKIIQKSSNEN